MSEIGSVTLLSGFGGPRRAPGKTDAETALRSFDAYFTGEMLKRATSPMDEKGLLDGGQAGRMYREFFYQEIARVVAEHSGFGLTDALAGHLKSDTGEQADVLKEEGS